MKKSILCLTFGAVFSILFAACAPMTRVYQRFYENNQTRMVVVDERFTLTEFKEGKTIESHSGRLIVLNRRNWYELECTQDGCKWSSYCRMVNKYLTLPHNEYLARSKGKYLEWKPTK